MSEQEMPVDEAGEVQTTQPTRVESNNLLAEANTWPNRPPEEIPSGEQHIQVLHPYGSYTLDVGNKDPLVITKEPTKVAASHVAAVVEGLRSAGIPFALATDTQEES